MNLSNYSIDNNVGGINPNSVGKNKLSEKLKKRILILLYYKGDKNPKQKDYEEISSEGEIIKLNDDRNL